MNFLTAILIDNIGSVPKLIISGSVTIHINGERNTNPEPNQSSRISLEYTQRIIIGIAIVKLRNLTNVMVNEVSSSNFFSSYKITIIGPKLPATKPASERKRSLNCVAIEYSPLALLPLRELTKIRSVLRKELTQFDQTISSH